ncbi:heme NO-binding domain-containing protein [Vibrio sp. HN007]|uniref:heme NO-binding domain-containing protein n=1 Tax=Vibrio iocasae TaxID=3098914 RepID=UPI0035D456F8
MKGIIFTEFMQLVEQKFGLEVLDSILDDAEDDGVYTTVGSYDHRSLVKLIVSLSEKTGVSATKLQEVFGETVFDNLYQTIPNQAGLKECQTAFQFIRHVEDYIHVEVKKLYPESNPPRFDFISESETEMVFDYQSARCMSHVCLGLVNGCAKHFNEQLTVKMQNVDPQGREVRFFLNRDTKE